MVNDGAYENRESGNGEIENGHRRRHRRHRHRHRHRRCFLYFLIRNYQQDEYRHSYFFLYVSFENLFFLVNISPTVFSFLSLFGVSSF